MPSSLLKHLCAFVCGSVLVGSVSARATTYYVDQARGNDRASGVSQQSPWQHLSAISRFAQDRGFKPGDNILLKAGGRWREQLDIINVHGKQGMPVRFGSYGAGEYPIIDGADTVATWTRVQGQVFQAAAPDSVYKVFVDGNDRPTVALTPVLNGLGNWQPGTQYQMWDQVQTPGKSFIAVRVPADPKHFGPADWFRQATQDAAPQPDGLTNVTQTAGGWWYDARGKRILVHLADGSSPAAHSIQITTRRYGVHLQGSSYVMVEGLRIVHTAKAGVGAFVADAPLADPSQDNQFNTVQNCIIYNTGDTTSDFSAPLNTGGEGGIYVAPGTGPGRVPLQGWVIRDNAIGTIDSVRRLIYERDGILVAGTTGAEIRNNYIATANALGMSIVADRNPACSSPRVSGNYLTNNDGNIRISGCAQPTLEANTVEYSYGYGMQIGGNSPGATVVRNVMHHIERLGQENAYNGLDCNGGAPGGTLRGNTIAAVWGAEATFELGCGNWTIEDNVFDSSENMKGGGLTLYIRRESPGLQFRNNTYRLNSATNRQFNFGAGTPGALTFHDFSWWQQTVEESAKIGDRPMAALQRRSTTVAQTPAASAYVRVAPDVKWEP